jgi:hypothetical protein
MSNCKSCKKCKNCLIFFFFLCSWRVQIGASDRRRQNQAGVRVARVPRLVYPVEHGQDHRRRWSQSSRPRRQGGTFEQDQQESFRNTERSR